jgi:hypothetical protein
MIAKSRMRHVPHHRMTFSDIADVVSVAVGEVADEGAGVGELAGDGAGVADGLGEGAAVVGAAGHWRRRGRGR